MPSEAKVIISWDQVFQAACEVRRQIGFWHPKRLIAVSRGGLVPTAIIANMMGIRNIETLSIYSYKGQNQGRVTLDDREGYWLARDVTNTDLIIDDICDSGHTARLIRETNYSVPIATLFHRKSGNLGCVTFPGIEAPQGWLEFPWETQLPEKIRKQVIPQIRIGPK